MLVWTEDPSEGSLQMKKNIFIEESNKHKQILRTQRKTPETTEITGITMERWRDFLDQF